MEPGCPQGDGGCREAALACSCGHNPRYNNGLFFLGVGWGVCRRLLKWHFNVIYEEYDGGKLLRM